MRFFDITRLCKRANAAAPSGIDRVDLAYLQWLRSQGPTEYLVHGMAGFAVIEQQLGDLFADKLAAIWRGEKHGVTPRVLRPVRDTAQLLRMAGKWQARRRGLADVLAAERLHDLCHESDRLDLLDLAAGEGAYRVSPRWRGQDRLGRFFGISHSMLGRTGYLAALAKHANVKRVLFIHDTIPCDYPEYCREHEGAKHLLRLRNSFRYATHIIVNSAYTAGRLEHWRQNLGAREVPVEIIPIGVDEGVIRHVRRPATSTSPVRPYFMVLGTIEPRKNHSLLINLWRSFVENLPPHEIPELLLVGRRGWDNESVFRQLDRCECLRGHLRELNGLRDDDLWPLLQGSRAMLFPSFVEGWGMPMVEALALGVPVIGSDIPPFREAGQGIPDLLSPLDGEGWGRLVLDYARGNSAARAAQLERIDRFRPPTWEMHFGAVESMLGDLGGLTP
jgi:glycosyltransferase involved in cell wall biosynthesis